MSCLGHGHPHVTAAIERQLQAVDYVHTSFFSSEPAERLAAHLVEHAPPGITYVSLVSGGSEAMESALKLARQTAVERGEPQRRHVVRGARAITATPLARWRLVATPSRAQLYDPLLFERPFHRSLLRLSLCRAAARARAYGRRAADQLEPKILELGPETVMAFVAETVVGATTGAVTAVAGLFPAHARNLRPLRRASDPGRGHVRHGPHRHAPCLRAGGRRSRSHDHRQGARSRDDADRGGAGRCEIQEAIASGSGLYQHGFTYMGHPLAAAAALAVQEVIHAEGLLNNVVRRGRTCATHSTSA